MHHYRAKIIIKIKYRQTKVVNYRQDNDDFNTLSTCTFLDCDKYRMGYNGQIDTTRCKRAVGIQYIHESKEDITGFISKPVARPEYRMIYQHKGLTHPSMISVWNSPRWTLSHTITSSSMLPSAGPPLAPSTGVSAPPEADTAMLHWQESSHTTLAVAHVWRDGLSHLLR